MNLNFKK